MFSSEAALFSTKQFSGDKKETRNNMNMSLQPHMQALCLDREALDDVSPEYSLPST